MITYPTNKLQKVLLSGGCVQNGTPTPDNPIDIVCNNGVLKVSKNLFDKNAVTTGKSLDMTGAPMNDIAGNISDYITVIPGQTYIRSLNGVAYGNVYFTYDQNKTFIAVYQPGSGVPFTILNGVSYIRFNVVNENLDTYQFEQGSTPTPYRPYGIYIDGTQEVVTDNLGNTANAERLLAVGDYKDTQEVLAGSVTRNVGIKVLDGTEGWTKYSASRNLYYNETIFSDVAIGAPILTTMCTHYQATNTNPLTDNTCRFTIQNQLKTIDGTRFYIDNESITSESDFANWLADQYNAGTPIIVVYPLAEPTTEQVTPQPLAGNSVTQTAGSINNLPIESSTIAELKKRYIGNREVSKVYIGNNLVYEQ